MKSIRNDILFVFCNITNMEYWITFRLYIVSYECDLFIKRGIERLLPQLTSRE